MARQDNQQSNESRKSAGQDGDLQRKSAGGGRSTPGDYSDPKARQGSSSGQDRSGNQVANDDDDDDQTYGRQAYQGDTGGDSAQGGSEGRRAPSRSRDDE